MGWKQQDCEYDHIEVRSKLSENELRKHGVFCGNQLPPLVTSEGNVLRIEFASDNSVQKTGFAAVFFTGMHIFRDFVSDFWFSFFFSNVFEPFDAD